MDPKTITPVLAFFEPGSAQPKTYSAASLTVRPNEQSESRFFVNGFNAPVERIEARIQCNGHTAKIVFRERLTLENKRRFWKGSLERGAPTRLGLSVILKISQYDPGRFPRTNYAVTIEATLFTPKKSETLRPTEAPDLLAMFADRAEPEDLTTLLEVVRR